MEIYLYKARQVGSRKVIKAKGQFESIDHINRYIISKNMVPLSIKKETNIRKKPKLNFFNKSKIKTQDIAFFCKQFGVLLEAGICIGEALDLLKGQIANPNLQKKVIEIDKDIQKGNSLSDSMAKHPEFPDLLVNIIKSGEASGRIDYVMQMMSIHYDKQLNLKRKLKKAITYPALVLSLALIMIPVMMIIVIPGFVDIFNEIEADLPKITQLIISFNDWIVNKWYMIILGFISTLLGLLILKKSDFGQDVLAKILLSIPGIGSLHKKFATALFSQTLSLLISTGVPIISALEITSQVMQNPIARLEIKESLNSVMIGNPISSSLESSKIYPKMMISMIRTGEETGLLDHMLEKTAHYYHAEVEVSLEQIAVLIEPLLMIFIAILVGVMMLAVILPTFSLASEFL